MAGYTVGGITINSRDVDKMEFGGYGENRLLIFMINGDVVRITQAMAGSTPVSQVRDDIERMMRH